MSDAWTRDIEILKAVDEKQIAYAVVWEPDAVDKSSDEDFADAAEVERMAHSFMRHYAMGRDTSGAHHLFKVERDRMHVVENFVAPADFEMGAQTVKQGSWVMAVHIPDRELWGKVKRGEFSGFSMEGRARRVPE